VQSELQKVRERGQRRDKEGRTEVMHLKMGWVVWLALTCLGTASAAERLVLFGGGNAPPQAMERFVAWSGGKAARILVISWAGGKEPDASFRSLKKKLDPFEPAETIEAPGSAEFPARKADFLSQLARATGVFFTGGQQARVMKVLQDEE